jgi:hypothetical protein
MLNNRCIRTAELYNAQIFLPAAEQTLSKRSEPNLKQNSCSNAEQSLYLGS